VDLEILCNESVFSPTLDIGERIFLSKGWKMDIDGEMKLKFTFTVDHEEFRLIGLSLSGKLRPEQIAKANELNLILLRQKLKLLNQMQTHLKNTEAAIEKESKE